MRNVHLNKIISGIGIAIVATAMMVNNGYAQEAKGVPEQGVVVATVDIMNAKITGQEENGVKIAFDIANKIGVQSQVRYDVFLSRITEKGIEVIDKEVYDESLVIKENETIHRDITYVAPPFLKGTYEVTLEAFTSEGLPLASVSAGSVMLVGSGEYAEIMPISCRLQVEGEASKKQYSAYRGIDINGSESLVLECEVKNGFLSTVKAFPYIVTYAGSEFGNSINKMKGEEMMLGKGKTQKMRIMLPVQQASGSYIADIMLGDENEIQASNKISVYYTVHGATASAKNVVFDKASYKKGEKAKISVTWLGAMGPFTDARLAQEKLGESEIATTLSDKNGTPCADVNVSKQDEGWRFMTLEMPVTKDCEGVNATIVTKNTKGEVIGTSIFATEKIVATAPAGKDNKVAVILVSVLVLIVIGLGGLFWKRRISNNAKATIFSLICIVGGGIAFQSASAMTQLNGVGSAGYIYTNQSAQDLSNAMMNAARTAGSPYAQNIQQTQLTYCSYLGYAVAASACKPPQTPVQPTPPRPNPTPAPVQQPSAGVSAPVTNRPPAGSVRCGTVSTTPNANCQYGTAGTSACIGGHASFPCVSNAGTWSCTNNFETAYCQTYVAPASVAQVGVCGSASGQSYASAPYAGLCTRGSASNLSGSGPWSWVCYGSGGGGSASCFATKTSVVVPGICGSSNNQAYVWAPYSGLCASGSVSGPSGSGPWNWTCVGSGGGGTASCSAMKVAEVVLGTCGPANNQAYTSAPYTGLCASGSVSGPSGSGPWNWTCAGSGGGGTASCSATKTIPVVLGTCGPANNQAYASAPSTGLCASGSASATSGSGPWNWTCAGSGGGGTASCSAIPIINGSCGVANGQKSPIAPRTGLCNSGTASATSGSGPWDWTCAGSGGGTATCSAPRGMRIIEVTP